MRLWSRFKKTKKSYVNGKHMLKQSFRTFIKHPNAALKIVTNKTVNAITTTKTIDHTSKNINLIHMNSSVLVREAVYQGYNPYRQ